MSVPGCILVDRAVCTRGNKAASVCRSTSHNLTVFSSLSTAPRLLRFQQGGLAAILRFRKKSEGLGDFSLLNKGTPNSNVADFLAGLLGILWLAFGVVDTATGPLSLLVIE